MIGALIPSTFLNELGIILAPLKENETSCNGGT
jgi:hypothetical protein